MNRGLALALVGALVVSTTVTAVSNAPYRPDTSRFVVATEQLARQDLLDGVRSGQGELVRADETLDFAVVELEDPAGFAEATGVQPVPDPRGSGAIETPIAEVPDDPYLPIQWGPIELNAPQAWQVTPDRPAVTVGIVDSGIDAHHPDLPTPGLGVEEGYDDVEDDETPNDEHGHGTHVAGIVTAIPDNGEGVAGMTQSRLYVTRVPGEDNSGCCSAFSFGLREAVDAGVDVINISVYCNSHPPPLHDAVQYAKAEGR